MSHTLIGLHPTFPHSVVTVLPPEIWLHIFKQSKRSDDLQLFTTTTTQRGRISSVTSLSQTCSYFQMLVTECPALWTSIRVEYTSSTADIVRRMERSRPLTVDISIFLDYNDRNGSIVEGVMDVLMADINRWRSVRIRLLVERTEHPVVMRLRDCRPLNLEYLSITVEQTEPGTSLLVPLVNVLTSGAPALVSARLTGVAHTLYKPPLTGLTTLRLESCLNFPMDLGMLTHLLAQPIRLENLLIRRDIIRPDVWALQAPGSIRLPHLQSLHLYSQSGWMYAGFLLAMDAPQLSALTLEGVFDRDLDSLWVQGVPQQFVNLSHLTLIAKDDISSTTYVKACYLFPNITTFAARRQTSSMSQIVTILQGITDREGKPAVVWPKLRAIFLAGGSLPQGVSRLQNALEARISLGFPLRQVGFFRSQRMEMPVEIDGWPTRFGVSVTLEEHGETLLGNDYIDVDDFQG